MGSLWCARAFRCNKVRASYRKFRHPASGYAVVGVAVVLHMKGERCAGGRIAATGFADHAFRAKAAEALLDLATGVAPRVASVSPSDSRRRTERFASQELQGGPCRPCRLCVALLVEDAAAERHVPG